MKETSKTWVTFVCAVTRLFFLHAFRVSFADVSETWPLNTLICDDEYGVSASYRTDEEICCFGIYPKYKGGWEQKCCKEIRKPYSFGLQLCCKDGIKMNIPGIESQAICRGYNTIISMRKRDQDTACQQKHSEHFLFCEATRNCYDPRKSTCCPNSPQLYDTPSSEGICCKGQIFNAKDDFPCLSPKQNYGFCQPKRWRRHSKKERKKQLEKICKSSHSYIIQIGKLEFKRNRNLYFPATVHQFVDQGFQQSIGNTTKVSIPLDSWMPSECKSIMEHSTFLVLSMTPPDRFLKDLLYIYDKTDTIFKKYKTNKCSLERIFRDFQEIKTRCIVKRRKNAHQKIKKREEIRREKQKIT